MPKKNSPSFLSSAWTAIKDFFTAIGRGILAIGRAIRGFFSKKPTSSQPSTENPISLKIQSTSTPEKPSEKPAQPSVIRTQTTINPSPIINPTPELKSAPIAPVTPPTNPITKPRGAPELPKATKPPVTPPPKPSKPSKPTTPAEPAVVIRTASTPPLASAKPPVAPPSGASNKKELQELTAELENAVFHTFSMGKSSDTPIKTIITPIRDARKYIDEVMIPNKALLTAELESALKIQLTGLLNQLREVKRTKTGILMFSGKDDAAIKFNLLEIQNKIAVFKLLLPNPSSPAAALKSPTALITPSKKARKKGYVPSEMPAERAMFTSWYKKEIKNCCEYINQVTLATFKNYSSTGASEKKLIDDVRNMVQRFEERVIPNEGKLGDLVQRMHTNLLCIAEALSELEQDSEGRLLELRKADLVISFALMRLEESVKEFEKLLPPATVGPTKPKT